MGDVSVTVELHWHVFEELMRDQLLLKHLHIGGVDNWDWYSEAYRNYEVEARSMGLIKEGDDDE